MPELRTVLHYAYLQACVHVHLAYHRAIDTVEEDEDTAVHTFNELTYVYNEHSPHLAALVLGVFA